MIRAWSRTLPATTGVVVLGLAGAATPAVGHTQHRQGTAVSAQDRAWLQSSIAGDRFEIRGGHLAERRGASGAVRALGARFAADHTRTLFNAIAIAHRFHIRVPRSPTAQQRAELRTLARFHGRAFDRQYTQLEITDHVMDIAAAQREIAQGTNIVIRNEARTDLGILETHLQLARDAQRAG